MKSINMSFPNNWSDFEYNKLKLLLHDEKIKSLLDVYNGKKEFDELPPISLELHLTDKCNLNCPWCTDKDQKEIGAVSDYGSVIRLMDYCARNHTGITLEGGGEPTMYPDFKKVVDYGKTLGLHMGLITNGTMDLSEVINSFRWVRISLDASNKDEYVVEKGSDFLSRVLNNIEKYGSVRNIEKCYLGIGYVLTKRNYSNIEQMVRKLDEFGVDYIYIRPVEEAPEITPSRTELYELRQELADITKDLRIKFMMTISDRLEDNNAGLPCVAHSVTSVIHADGNVVLCEKRRHDPIIIGNIREIEFDKIWDSQARIAACRKLIDCNNQIGCSVCRVTSFNKIINNLINIRTENFI